MKYAISASYGNDSMAMIQWAKYSPGQYKPGIDDLFTVGCGSPFGCGL